MKTKKGLARIDIGTLEKVTGGDGPEADGFARNFVPYGVGGVSVGSTVAAWRNVKATRAAAQVAGVAEVSRFAKNARRVGYIGLGITGAELLNGAINSGRD